MSFRLLLSSRSSQLIGQSRNMMEPQGVRACTASFSACILLPWSSSSYPSCLLRRFCRWCGRRWRWWSDTRARTGRGCHRGSPDPAHNNTPRKQTKKKQKNSKENVRRDMEEMNRQHPTNLSIYEDEPSKEERQKAGSAKERWEKKNWLEWREKRQRDGNPKGREKKAGLEQVLCVAVAAGEVANGFVLLRVGIQSLDVNALLVVDVAIISEERNTSRPTTRSRKHKARQAQSRRWNQNRQKETKATQRAQANSASASPSVWSRVGLSPSRGVGKRECVELTRRQRWPWLPTVRGRGRRGSRRCRILAPPPSCRVCPTPSQAEETETKNTQAEIEAIDRKEEEKRREGSERQSKRKRRDGDKETEKQSDSEDEKREEKRKTRRTWRNCDTTVGKWRG